jgi:Protein of unknown function (DUF3999)
MRLARSAWAPAFAGVTFIAGLTPCAWADSPSDYRSHAEIAKGSGDTLHRVTLPFEVYRDTRLDFGDLRVFNAAGESLPFAFASEPSTVREEAAPVVLPVFPVAGTPQATGQLANNLDVVVKSNANGTIVSVQGRPAIVKPEAEPKSKPVAWLLDASQVGAPIKSLLFEWDVGPGTEIVRVSVDGSEDLKTWSRLISQVQLVHVEQGGAKLEQKRVDLRPGNARYLRVVGDSAGFQLKSVSALREDQTKPPTDRLTLGAIGTQTSSPGEFMFLLGGHIPIEAVRLMLPPDTVAPVSVSTAPTILDKQVFLTSATFYRMVKDGAVIESTPVEVGRRVACCVYVKLDPKAPALQGPLQIAVSWHPQQIVFAARGDGPYSLAFGNRNAQRTGMAIDQLIPGYKAGDDAKIAEDRIVRVTTSVHPPGVVESAIGEVNLHKMILWAVLLFGAALLGWMAWRLARKP